MTSWSSIWSKHLPTTDIYFGRINSNVLSVLDLEQLEWRWIVPLDLSGRGAANPWAVSLLLAHQTPPSMWLGVRTNAEIAVRAGLRYILFTEQPDSVAQAIDDYLKSLRLVPSPRLVEGKLSARAERGEGVVPKRKDPLLGVP